MQPRLTAHLTVRKNRTLGDIFGDANEQGSQQGLLQVLTSYTRLVLMEMEV